MNKRNSPLMSKIQLGSSALVAALLAMPGCAVDESSEETDAEAPSQSEALAVHPEQILAERSGNVHEMLACGVSDTAGSGRANEKKFPLSNIRKILAKVPELRAKFGARVTTCEDAVKFERAYHEYLERRDPVSNNADGAADDGMDVLETETSTGEKESGYIFEGQSTDRKGILRIKFHDNTCTGTIISKYHILTAAHCVSNPGSQFVAIGGEGMTTPKSVQAFVYVHDDWAGGADYDMALISISNPSMVGDVKTYFDTSANRYRVNIGDSTIGQRLGIFGYGYLNNAGDLPAIGSLREGKNGEKVVVEGWSGRRYSADSGVARRCLGDSGGPAIEEGIYAYPIVWGLAESFQRSGTDLCATPGGTQYWTKINNSDMRDWLIKEIRKNSNFGSTYNCETFGTTGKRYWRCW